jgi:DMSO reductase anchor subunit
MPIKIHYFKYLCISIGLMLLYTAIADKDWNLAGVAVVATVFLGLFGYGVERLWFYINRNPGGTRLSRFLIGR